MITAVHAFADDLAPAGRLALALDVPASPIDLHVFPDGESLPRVAAARGAVALYRSLDRPDSKLMPLILAADALRRRGADRVVLVAPYLAYMRQDAVFHPGEPLSRDVLGRLLGERFEAVVTVEPHLHRTSDLAAAFCGAKVVALSATGLLAETLAPAPANAVVVGPDGESDSWAGALGQALGRGHLAFEKVRSGDRDVRLTLADPGRVRGRPVILVDDVCSTGATLEAALRQLRDLGAGPIDVAIVHALFDSTTQTRLQDAGARRIISTDSCPNPTNRTWLAPLLAAALKGLRP